MDKNKQQTLGSGLYIVSTPIGNIEDITIRSLNVLKRSDIILCEDTRRSLKLMNYFNIKKKLIPYHKFNEKKVSNKIVDVLKKNKIVSLISDAGTPTISDPGIILVNICIAENLNVYPIPGTSAVTAAVSASGFDDQYLFYGFLPKKEGALQNTLIKLQNLDYSIVFFIPASKINFYITEFKKYFFDRKIVIAKEMTKIYEEFIRDNIVTIQNSQKNLKGEITVVLSKKIKEKKNKKEINESVKIEIKKMLEKHSHKDVVNFFSKRENFPKKIIYNYCLKLKK